MANQDEQHDDKQEEKAKQQSLPLAWERERSAQAGAERRPQTQQAFTGSGAADLSPTVPETDDSQENNDEPVVAKPAEPTTRPPRSSEPIIKLGEIDMTVGQRLLEARGARNLSIEQVVQKTRIPRQFIEQVENDQFDRLPPPVYSRSHIAQLCREYGIETEPILEEYRRQAGSEESPEPVVKRFRLNDAPSDAAAQRQFNPRIAREVVSGRLLSDISRYAVAVALVLLLALVLLAFAVQQFKNYRRRQAEANLGTAPVTAPAESIELEELMPPQQLPLRELPFPE